MLCIFTSVIGAPSETFIHHHFERIAPGSTVGACFDRLDAAWSVDGPVIQLVPPHRPRLPRAVRQVLGAWNLASRGCTDPLRRSDEAALGQFLRAHQVNVLLAEYGNNACAVQRVCDRVGIPLVAHFHGWDASNALRFYQYRHAYRRLLPAAAAIVCPSHYLANRLRRIGLPDRTLHVVPYGIDTARFDVTPGPRDATLLAVGRFVEKKAPQCTIEAFARISSRHPAARLEMVGDGPLLAACRTLAAALGVHDRVIFHGSRDHTFVHAAMARAAVFVQHSVTAPNGDTEGLPVAILEAMACGLPVVATLHAGIPEAVVEGDNGYLVPELDVQRMADAIDAVLSNAALRERMGRTARSRARAHFSAERQISRLRAILGLETGTAAAKCGPHFIGTENSDRAGMIHG